MPFALAVRVALVMSLPALAPVVGAQTSTGAGTQIVLGATVAQRHEAARALVPLLKGVKAHAQPGLTVKPGSEQASGYRQGS